jgi:hypothetical protein
MKECVHCHVCLGNVIGNLRTSNTFIRSHVYRFEPHNMDVIHLHTLGWCLVVIRLHTPVFLFLFLISPPIYRTSQHCQVWWRVDKSVTATVAIFVGYHVVWWTLPYLAVTGPCYVLLTSAVSCCERNNWRSMPTVIASKSVHLPHIPSW